MHSIWQSVQFIMGSFKKSVFVLVIFILTSIAQAHSAPDILFNYHFVGTDELFKTTNTATLKKVWDMPETATLRDGILDRLAGTPRQALGASKDSATLLRPLIDELLKVESVAEVRSGSNGPGEVLIAVRISKDQLPRWNTNLQKIITGLTKTPATETKWEKFTGWEVKQKQSPNIIRSIWTGDWLVLGIGQDELPLQNNILRRLANGGTPVEWKGKTNWFEATIDLPRLQTWIPMTGFPLKPARAEIALSNKDDNMRTHIRATYPQALNWKPQKWQIPTNIIRDPLVSFTASQNLSVLVKSPDILDQTGQNPLKSQSFVWSMGQLPFMTFGAVAVKDSDKTFKQLSGQLPKLFNPALEQAKAGKVMLSTNKESILWIGLSMIAPQLQATNDSAGQFIFASIFPPPPSKLDPPRELIEQVVSKPNLIYYDWEITQYRLSHWQMLTKMIPFLAPKRAPVPPELVQKAKEDPSVRAKLSQRIAHERWQSKVAPSLGNTITEVTLVAPNEIEVIRKSHIGFTGIELVYLTHWLNDPRFPLFREDAQP